MISSEKYPTLQSSYQRHKRATPAPANALEFYNADICVSFIPTGKTYEGELQLGPYLQEQRATAFLWEDERVKFTAYDEVSESVVEETTVKFTHGKTLEWFLPGVQPTDREILVDFVKIVSFKNGKVSSKRIYWDQASVLRQLNLPLTALKFEKSKTVEKTVEKTIEKTIEKIVEPSTEPKPKAVDFHPTTASSKPSIRLHNAPGGRSSIQIG
jgi:hypothetical protein